MGFHKELTKIDTNAPDESVQGEEDAVIAIINLSNSKQSARPL